MIEFIFCFSSFFLNLFHAVVVVVVFVAKCFDYLFVDPMAVMYSSTRLGRTRLLRNHVFLEHF